MMSKEIQERLLRVIREKMIPEYKMSLEEKQDLKGVFLDYLENDYLTEKDRELIKKYPESVCLVDNLPIAYYSYYGSSKGINVECFKGYFDGADFGRAELNITFDKKIPKIVSYISELSENEEAWKKVGPILHKYMNHRNTYIKKLNLAYEFVSHKNTTLALIKTEFPELYKFYIDDRTNNRDKK